MTKYIPRSFSRLKNQIDGPEAAALAFILMGILIAVGGYIILYGWGSFQIIVGDFYANIAAELISIAITVLIIERLNRRRSENEEKKALILQMASPENAFAIEAVRQLGQRGWLSDQSLNDAYLRRANLSDAKLSGADMRGCNLFASNLSSATLSNTNLSNANMSNANLSYANLSGSNLSNANLSRADLGYADLRYADLRDVILNAASYNSYTRWPTGFNPKEFGPMLNFVDGTKNEPAS
ncbi:MAG: pentapeptide repeat-containing protein [Chloroflexota bacterium]